MKNTKMYDTEDVLRQYKDGKNLSTRISIYDKYKVGGNYSGWIQDAYSFFDGCEIVEFGSGTGKDWAGKMDGSARKCHITLSDFSPGMVSILKEKYGHYKNVDIMRIDIQDIPLADASKDFAIAHSMLYHVPDIDRAVSEVHRILKPGGRFYAATSGGRSLFLYFKDTLHEAVPGSTMPDGITFTLKNGKPYLDKYFSDVKIVYDRGRLEITDTNDLIDFILSAASIGDVSESDRPRMFDYYESAKNADGKIIVDLEYGMFVAEK